MTNAGPAVAVATHLADQLPEGAEFVSATLAQGTASSTSDVICELGDMASAATATVTIVVRVIRPGTAVNIAYATSQMLDETSGNNQAQATTEVAGEGGARSGRGPGPARPVGPGRPACWPRRRPPGGPVPLLDPGPVGGGQDRLAQAHRLGRHLDGLVVGDELQRLLERQIAGRGQPDQLLGGRRPHVGELLLLGQFTSMSSAREFSPTIMPS